MKILTKIVLLLSLCICGTMTSQTERPISELLEELSKNHMGSVTDVFTLQEIQTIKDHYAATTFPSNTESVLENIRHTSTQSVSQVQAVDINPVNINVIEILANSPITEFPGAGAPASDLFPGESGVFIIDNGNTVWLRGLGPAPVTFQNLGALTGLPPGHSLTGIEVLPGPMGQLFGMSTNGVDESNLVLIDITTRNATPVGSNNGLILPIALARDGTGNLITGDIDDDMTYRINPVTGATTPIGPQGYNSDFGQAWFFDESTGTILTMSYNGVIGDSELRTINPITGASVSLGTIQPGTVQQFGWGTSYDRDLLDIGDSKIDGFSFYPNPAQDQVTLAATNTIDTIEVYSVLGQMVINKSIKANTAEVDISHLVSGAYILKVSTSNQTGAYKLIKQ